MTASTTDFRRRLEDALRAARTEPAGRPRPHGRSATPAEDTRLLGLLLVGVSSPAVALVGQDAAGYGSEVTIEDVESGEWIVHRLMSAEAMDLDAGHVTTDSPLGAALLGGRAGDVVSFETPRGTRRVCIARVETLPALLDRLERERAEAAGASLERPDRAEHQPRTGTYG